jgi:hypothetical protein
MGCVHRGGIGRDASKCELGSKVTSFENLLKCFAAVLPEIQCDMLRDSSAPITPVKVGGELVLLLKL